MGAIQIRLATDADNEKIMDLARRCPQKGMITFLPNRTPRFNSLHRLLDPDTWHYVACKDDKIIGLVGVVHFHARILDQVRKMGFIMDLRVDEAYRSGLTAFRLVKTIVDHLLGIGVDMVISNFIKDNKASLVFTSGRGGIPVAHHLGDNRFLNIIPIVSMRLNKRFTIEKPTTEDIPELLQLYRNYAANFKIAPEINEERFRNYVENIEGLSLDQFIIARENGKIKAVTAMWDEHTYNSYTVLEMNFTSKVIVVVLKFLSLFMRVPHPVRLNEPLRQLALVLYAHDDCPEALDTLFRHANNINLGADYTLITLHAQQNDPVFNFLKKFKTITITSQMFFFYPDPGFYEKLKNDPSPVMFDIVLTL